MVKFNFFVYKIWVGLLLGRKEPIKGKGPYMKKHKTINTIAKVLLIIGGLAWGLIGVFDFEPVGTMFNQYGADGQMVLSPLTRIIYVLFGLAALYRLYVWTQAKKK